MDDETPSRSALDPRLASLRTEFLGVALRDRWGLILMVIGWGHLAFCVVYQVLLFWDKHQNWHHVSLWVVEVAFVVAVFRAMAGRGWYRVCPLAGIVVRVWATFLILTFTAATLNSLIGLQAADWFKLVWTTLSTFGFATMAWLLNLWFLVPAVQMYFTGLLMAITPGWHYLIYGISWCLALQGIGLALEWRRLREASTSNAEGRLEPVS